MASFCDEVCGERKMDLRKVRPSEGRTEFSFPAQQQAKQTLDDAQAYGEQWEELAGK